MGVGAFGHDQLEWDRAVHQYRAIAELAPDAFAKVEKAILNVSNATGVNKLELLEAAKGWQELGNSPTSFIKNAEIAARTSRVTGISVAEQMKESSALLRAFGANLNDPEQFKHYEEVYLVASKGMKGGAEAFGEAMQSWAPIASGLGLTFEQAAAFAQTLGGQFDASAIGNALKTGMMRLVAPVPKSKAMLESAGIDPTSFGNFDEKKLRDGDALVKALKGTGSFNISRGMARMIQNELAHADLSQGIDPVMERLNTQLVKGFGGKKVSAQDRKILQATLLNFFSGAMTGLDPKKFFETFAPLAKNVAFMSQVFGKEHAAKFMDLLKQAEHYGVNLENILEHAPGALERKWSIFGEGFAFQFSRAQTAIDNLMNSVAGAGIRGDMEGVFKSIADMFDSAQKIDPETLRGLFYVFAGVAALAPLGYVISGIASSLSLLAAIAGSPIVITIAGAYLLYEVWQNWDKLTKAKDRISFVVDLVLNNMLPDWAKHLIETGAKNLNQGAFDNQLQNNTHGGRWDRLQDWLSGKSHEETFSPFGGGGAKSPLQLLDLHAQQINVTGSAEVRTKLEATIKVDGNGQVTKQSTTDGRAEVPLNTGRSMSDTDKSYGGGH
ncbi:phage tail tape measure protein [Hyphomicrobium denitrificans]|nr:phage tail tape measure protein [Hyphomicrobium denitrificans]